MKLVVGLGNPEQKYQFNRHNAGYLLVDAVKKESLPEGVVAKKTGLYMNESGPAVKKFLDQQPVGLDDLYVVHDDLDLHLGDYKVQKGKGPKDHKGLQSIYQTLGQKDFWHVRIGIDNRLADQRLSGEEYVLDDFTPEERESLKKVFAGLIPDLYHRLKEGQ